MKMFSMRLDDEFRERISKANKAIGIKSIAGFFLYASEKLFREIGV